jgi:hypothetical protein
MCVCFIEWLKARDLVNWTKSVQIFEETLLTGETIFFSILHIDQRVKLRLDQRLTGNVKTGRGVRQERFLSPILFKLQSEYLFKGALEMFGDSKILEQVICTVNYAGDPVLLVKK